MFIYLPTRLVRLGRARRLTRGAIGTMLEIGAGRQPMG